MKPGKIIYNAVDCHIYKNNIESLEEQLKNTPSPTPFLYLNPQLKDKKWEEMTFKDFELIGYMPKQAPPMKMAI
jgi:thymidylate synthase